LPFLEGVVGPTRLANRDAQEAIYLLLFLGLIRLIVVLIFVVFDCIVGRQKRRLVLATTPSRGRDDYSAAAARLTGRIDQAPTDNSERDDFPARSSLINPP
jgi:hypothetical protein